MDEQRKSSSDNYGAYGLTGKSVATGPYPNKPKYRKWVEDPRSLKNRTVTHDARNGIYSTIVNGTNPDTGQLQSDTTFYVPHDVFWSTDYRGEYARNPENRLYQLDLIDTDPALYLEMKAKYDLPTFWEKIGNFFTPTTNYLNIMSGGHR